MVRPGTLTPAMVYDALKDGHAYVGIPLVADASGFHFTVQTDTDVLGIMGDEVEFRPGMWLSVTLPAAAQMVLRVDDIQLLKTTGKSWQVPVMEPGVFRIEVTRFGKPWIFSNPIYIRPAKASGDAPAANP